MKKKVLSITVIMTMVLSLLSSMTTIYAATSFGGGSGTKNDPYQIGTAEQLKNLATNVNGGTTYSGNYFMLTNNIDITEIQWPVIGSKNKPFSGTFDGKNHTISGLNIDVNNTNFSYMALFGYNKGTIKNLTVDGSVAVDSRYAGGICGINAGKIDNCCNLANVSARNHTSDDASAGGICVSNEGTISNCVNRGHISTFPAKAGGICYSNSDTITNCYNTGVVDGADFAKEVGGICGFSNSTITNCYNTGKVRVGIQFADIGGICGFGGVITNCYNVGQVLLMGTTNKDDSSMGPIFGSGAYITNCYYLEGLCVDNAKTLIGNSYGESSTSAQFANKSSFKNWDFSKVWGMSTALGRPVLRANLESESGDLDGSGQSGSPFTYSAATTSGTFKLARGIIPAGLTLDASTGVISGTPTSFGLYPNVWVQTTDASGRVTEAQHSIFIKPRAVTVQITNCDYTYTEGQTYQATVTCTTDESVLLTVTYGTNRTSSVTEPGMYAIHIHAKDCEVTKIIDGDGNERSPDNIWLTVK